MNLKSDFSNQVYYSIKTKSIVTTNSITDWDLAFTSTRTGAIFLNSSKEMLVAVTNRLFDEVNSIDKLNFTYDKSNLKPAQSAFGILKTTKTYIINRGKNLDGTDLGYVKMEFTTLSGNEYIFRYANLTATSSRSIRLNKDTDFGKIMFSFNDGIVPIEPDNSNWGLLFTKYLHASNDTRSNEVGVLVNAEKIDVAKMNKPANELTTNDIVTAEFSNSADVIGFDWKSSNEVDKNRSYLLIT